MSRDDYISKLFIKNQHKLEQAPSDDLWSKLELQLEQELPVTTQAAPPKIFRLSRYFAAASVLVAVVGSIYLFKMVENATQNQHQLTEPLAISTEPPVSDAEPYEDYDILPTEAVEDKEKEEIRVQEEKIVEAVNEKVQQTQNSTLSHRSAPSKIELGDIEIVGEKEAEDIILIEPEVTPKAATMMSSDKIHGAASGVNANADLYLNSLPIAEEAEQNLNYNRSYVPQIANTIDNNPAVEQVLNQSKVKKKPKATSKKTRARGKRREIVNKNKANKKIKSPMAAAHPSLYPFGFLLGKWGDEHELEGKSYEVWTLKNATTLVGRGYKLSNDAERIFEEVMRIEFRNNQTFLVMSLDEDKSTVDYMLVSFDNERFEFEQSESRNYPNRVIIQQSGLDGYTVVILNNYDFLTADQQRYLENRNRVSNKQSIRTMRYAD
ncbi:DUF6265 family protein [Aureispira anguillae]|uniref:DUF6265 family protein n=1 Tax=Aureispira anguillae TaxID=2864201 RepID=A0A915YB63_9BACT|nr:DUF6265 family protein [Aureispira anguillae]BDS09856.1 DUF6265 family protein [Aureispira anguillae]